MRNNLAILPCSTQFTVSEFEEYFFHREKIRIIVRATRGLEKEHNRILYRANQVVRTSHFEQLLRKRNGGNSDDSMLLHELISDVKKGSDIDELAVVLGDGTIIEYSGYMMEHGVEIGHSNLPVDAIRTYTLAQVRDGYQKCVNDARAFETAFEFENFYRTGG